MRASSSTKPRQLSAATAGATLTDDDAVQPVFATLVRLDAEVADAHAHIAEVEARIKEQEAAREDARPQSSRSARRDRG